MPILRDITLGQYYPGNSYLHRLDPRSKLITSLIFMTNLLFGFNVKVLLLNTLVCLGGIILSGVPIGIVAKNLRPFVWLFVITFLLHAFSTPGEALFIIPGVDWNVTLQGISNGAAYVMRLTFLIVLAALFTLTTTPVDLTQGLSLLLRPLKRLKVPVHEFALMMTLTLRFVPILLREAQRVKNAQLSRGVSLEGTLLARVRNLLPMLVPLFISAIRRAEDLAMAMEARSYVSDGKRTSFHELGFRIDDIELFVFTFIFLGVASAVR